MASVSATEHHCWEYDVFLSFRGTDTRDTFTSHLYHALHAKGVHTFIHDNLERGEEISPSLLQAIGRSRISIIVFSQDYAFSCYCLDELVKILQCREFYDQKVIPIFYKVDPREVQFQTERFGEAFREHEGRFPENLEKVQVWRTALAKAAELSGWHLDNGDEGELIKSVVDKVIKLKRPTLHVAEHPIGLNSRMQEINRILKIEENDVRMIGIFGVDGIGKTTVAKAIYNQIASQFEGCCFLPHVRASADKYGIGNLQEILLSDILGYHIDLKGNIHRGINEIKHKLPRKKVLLVIDDANDSHHLDNLAGGLDWFGGGSRIIITTRDKRLLDCPGFEQYKMRPLCDDEALQLFSWKAFKKPRPLESFVILSRRAVDYAKGLPLVLIILVSLLYNRGAPEWENELDKLERVPNKKIYEIFKTSYDDLEENEQTIFLDVACFFRGMDKDYVMKILDACDLRPVIGVQALIEKSLLSIENNKLQMHDVLQSIAKRLVDKKSHKFGERSRLWCHEEIVDVLKENMGTDEIEGILLDPPELEEIQLSSEAFAKMKSLRILFIRNAKLKGCAVHLPNKLRWLEWRECPLPSMPHGFHARRLVGLDIQNSSIRQLGEGFKEYRYLKFLNLKDCRCLMETPDFSTIPNLESLNMESCTNLVAVHHSLGNLSKLEFLSLEFCSNLTTLPTSLKLKSLHTLLLTNCEKLKAFPNVDEEMPFLEKACLNGTAIEVIPSSIENLSGLKLFTLTHCKNLISLPSSIYKLEHLTCLLAEGCSKLGVFPRLDKSSFSDRAPDPLSSNYKRELRLLRCLDLRKCNLSKVHFLKAVYCFSMLKDLDLSENNFVSLPKSIVKLCNLRSLKLSKCMNLEEIPDLPWKIKRVEARDCKLLKRYAQLVKLFEYDVEKKRSMRLFDIDFSNCPKLAQYVKTNLEHMLYLEAFGGVYRQDCRIEMFLPGNVLPEWFDYKSEGGSLSFSLDADIRRKVTGIVICAIVGLDDEGMVANISREVFVEGQNVISFSRELFSLEGDHLWLYYLPRHFLLRGWGSREKDLVQLEVSFTVLGALTASLVRCTGVYLLRKKEDRTANLMGNSKASVAAYPCIGDQTESNSVDLKRSCNETICPSKSSSMGSANNLHLGLGLSVSTTKRTRGDANFDHHTPSIGSLDLVERSDDNLDWGLGLSLTTKRMRLDDHQTPPPHSTSSATLKDGNLTTHQWDWDLNQKPIVIIDLESLE